MKNRSVDVILLREKFGVNLISSYHTLVHVLTRISGQSVLDFVQVGLRFSEIRSTANNYRHSSIVLLDWATRLWLVLCAIFYDNILAVLFENVAMYTLHISAASRRAQSFHQLYSAMLLTATSTSMFYISFFNHDDKVDINHQVAYTHRPTQTHPLQP